MPRTPKQFLRWHDDEGNLRPFSWDTKKARAASMVAEGWPHTKIGAALRIDPPLVSYWRRHPEFSRRVQRIIVDAGAEAATIAIANRVNRIRDYDNLRTRYLQIMDERAENRSGDPEAGMSTGLVVKKERVTTTRNGQITETEYSVDNQTTSSLLTVLKQAAQETNQWNEKSKIEISGGIERTYVLEDIAGVVIEPFDIEAEIQALDDGSDE